MPTPTRPATAAAPAITVTGRLDRLRAAFDEHEIDALVVTTLANVRYLTGFTGSAGVLTVTRDAALLTTDGRYRTQSAEQVERAGAAGQVDIAIGPAAEQRKAAPGGARRRRQPAASASRPTTSRWSAQRTWADLLGGDRLVATTNAVEALRESKDAAEIARMERAAAIADAALFEVLPLMSQGVTEEHFALELDTAMRRGGAESTAFETIVAAGENSAKPHHHPGSRRIDGGDPVVVDFGATFEGYRSDMTRTFCVDAEPEGELARIFDVVGDVAGRRRRRGAPRHHAPRRSTTSAAASSPRPAGPSASSTAPATASASISTRPRRSANWALLSSPPASSSPSSPASTFPGTAGSASRTPWS